MSRLLTVLAPMVLLGTVAFLGTAPTATAEDDCGDACIENCYAFVGTGGASASCEVAHQPQGATFCVQSDCGDPIALCHALDGQDPNCEVYQPPEELCVGPQGGPSQWGVCYSPTHPSCVVWLFVDFWTVCLVDKPST